MYVYYLLYSQPTAHRCIICLFRLQRAWYGRLLLSQCYHRSCRRCWPGIFSIASPLHEVWFSVFGDRGMADISDGPNLSSMLSAPYMRIHNHNTLSQRPSQHEYTNTDGKPEGEGLHISCRLSTWHDISAFSL